METILLGLVVILCIYILYCIFTPNYLSVTEPFAPYAMPDNYEKILGNLATTIQSPAQWDIPANSATNPNPTGLIATYSNPLDPSRLTNIQNIYSTALGNPNAGPRMDDNNSFLYMVDFCYQKGKDTNPFSDTTFSRNCGMCMTTGTLLNGTGMPGSNGLGVVVYQADKDYSLSQGIDAVPSSHSATCAPLVKLAGISSNVTSLAINAQQLNETRAYLQSNSYTISAGTGAGQSTLTCTGTSNGHPYVIKAGASRAGAWDTHIAGAPIDYTRKNLLTTVPFPGTCTEERSCTVTSPLQQWDMSAVCGYPKPTPITNLTVDTSQTTATSLKFVWGGGLYADTYDYNLLNLTANVAVPANKSILNSATKSVAYTGLTANTQYRFTLTIRNSAGIADGSYTTGSASGFTNYEEGFAGSVIGATLDDRDPIILEDASEITTTGFRVNWRGGNNAVTVTLSIRSGGTTLDVPIPSNAKSYAVSSLQPGTQYTYMITSSYNTPGTFTVDRTVTTASLPPAAVVVEVPADAPPAPPTNQLITSAQWLSGRSPPMIRIIWTTAVPRLPSWGPLIGYRIIVSPNPSVTVTPAQAVDLRAAGINVIQNPQGVHQLDNIFASSAAIATSADLPITIATVLVKYVTVWPYFQFQLEPKAFFPITGSPESAPPAPPTINRIITSAQWTSGRQKQAIDVTWNAAPRSTELGELVGYFLQVH